jgi:hypothetical protein
LFDEAVDLRQTEPGALSDFLGREERIESLSTTSGGIPVPVSLTKIPTYWPGVTSAFAALL